MFVCWTHDALCQWMYFQCLNVVLNWAWTMDLPSLSPHVGHTYPAVALAVPLWAWQGECSPWQSFPSSTIGSSSLQTLHPWLRLSRYPEQVPFGAMRALCFSQCSMFNIAHCHLSALPLPISLPAAGLSQCSWCWDKICLSLVCAQCINIKRNM